jgi:ketosteroid isomerase-like protein
MSDLDLIAFANEAFYRAFAALDFALMTDVWAHDLEVRCMHPGSEPLFGREPVLASWREIFKRGQAGMISYQVRETSLIGGIGMACCFEVVNGHFGIATNLFAREGNRWRMIHHQAGPLAKAPREIVEEPPPLAN